MNRLTKRPLIVNVIVHGQHHYRFSAELGWGDGGFDVIRLLFSLLQMTDPQGIHEIHSKITQHQS